MKSTLDATEKELVDLRRSLAGRIGKAIDRAGFHYVFHPTEEPGNSVTYELRCGDDGMNELALDDRGQELVVIPIAVGRGWRILMGASTSWRRPVSRKRGFSNAQIIGFLERTKPSGGDGQGPIQFMRLEWEALDRNDNRTGSIAHPHWQIDIGKYALSRPAAPPSLAIREEIPARGGADGLSWMSKLHLAACARWMDSPWRDDVHPAPHVHDPQSLEQLSDWMSSACRYLHNQLSGALDS